MMGDILKFEIKHHSLNLYGNCSKLRDGGCDRKNVG
jgi:Fur family ferric uptake transcriptional regulator